MLPFDRLIKAMDRWSGLNSDVAVIAQIGSTSLRPRHMLWHAMLTPAEYKQQCVEADLIVSHVGMGTVLTASEVGKPLVALPRSALLNEVTSDHQSATAKWLRKLPGIIVIEAESELDQAITTAFKTNHAPLIESGNRSLLVSALRNFIRQSSPPE